MSQSSWITYCVTKTVGAARQLCVGKARVLDLTNCWRRSDLRVGFQDNLLCGLTTTSVCVKSPLYTGQSGEREREGEQRKRNQHRQKETLRQCAVGKQHLKHGRCNTKYGVGSLGSPYARSQYASTNQLMEHPTTAIQRAQTGVVLEAGPNTVVLSNHFQNLNILTF